MIARESLEKSLPRLASAAPFLCLIDDHLLCPDTNFLPHGFQEQFVQPRVVRQLGVERGHEVAPVARQHRASVDLRSTSTSGPTSSIHGARMKTARTGSSAPST